MNHEPSGSASTATDEHTTNDAWHAILRAPRERRKRNRLLFNKKREYFLKDFSRNIDILIYAELAAIYYMDCSFIRFFIRASVQFMFLTPKPAFLPEPPQNRPYIGAIFGANLLCLFFHLINPSPAASEATRGYLHGGLAMDFIGQKGPTSKLHLSMLDMLVLLLQLVALGAHVTRIKVKKQATPPPAVPAVPQPPTQTPPVQPTQDLDHEERGLHRSEHDPVDIELQNLNPSARQQPPDEPPAASIADEEGDDERDTLLSSSTQPSSDAHIFDAFNSGEIMIADLNIINLIHTQMRDYRNAPSESTATPPGPGFTERLSGNGLGLRLRIGNRILRV